MTRHDPTAPEGHRTPVAWNGALDADEAETARIILASLAPATRRAYGSALASIADWHDGRTPDDASMAAYLTARFESGASPSSLRMAVAAVRWMAKATDRPAPVGRRTSATLKRLNVAGADRGRGQASALTYDEALRIVALSKPLDGAIVALVFMAGLRRSEAAALQWRDVEDGADGTLLLHVRRSKTNQDGSSTDIRLVKNGFADALRALRGADADPDGRVLGIDGRTITRRLQAAARNAGITRKISAHSGRVGLASELTARGASTTEVMLAGAWKTARMVSHYSAGARAERGAVAKYM